MNFKQLNEIIAINLIWIEMLHLLLSDTDITHDMSNKQLDIVLQEELNYLVVWFSGDSFWREFSCWCKSWYMILFMIFMHPSLSFPCNLFQNKIRFLQEKNLLLDMKESYSSLSLTCRRLSTESWIIPAQSQVSCKN